jgi:8-oxo-dGTP diphosphatase
MEPAEESGPRQVAIALVRRGSSFLVRIRPPRGPMPGVSEFPGGKCEPGEAPEDAAAREVEEEAGLRVRVTGLRRSFEHRYPHGWLELYYFDCEALAPGAEPDPASGFRWADARELPTLTFPPANEAVVADLVATAAVSPPDS